MTVPLPQVENPIPFAESGLTRVMTTGYLHARYFGLLLAPLHLSADWSFNCIPLLEELEDPRNAATAALYAYIIFVGLSAGPLQLLLQLHQVVKQALSTSSETPTSSPAAGSVKPAAERPAAGTQQVAGGAAAATVAGNSSLLQPSTASVSASLAAARWRLLILLGLLVAPFFPASNVLFYVGTFIGERLLYFPSIGFCLMLAELLGRMLSPLSGPPSAPASAAGSPPKISNTAADAAGSPSAAAGSSSSAGRRWCFLAVAAALLAGYAGRTFVRNIDWWDEERLFLSALDVCPNSAKVQLNCGVLQRRYLNHAAALKHFRWVADQRPCCCINCQQRGAWHGCGCCCCC